ncbi:MAG: hypothetical protein CMN78_05005 [Spirochaetales bacterium]|nr:hypothetical protein [Spirochaetales bacterium]
MLILAMVLTVPAMLYLNVWQTIRYEVIESQIESLESEQHAWVEENKKIIVAIEVLGSPARVDEISAQVVDLHRDFAVRDFRIQIRHAEGPQ